MISSKAKNILSSAVLVIGLSLFPVLTAASNYDPRQSQTGFAEVLASPALSIPSLIPAVSNSFVMIPVQFNSNGTSIASLGFSIDYDQTWLVYNPAAQNPFTLNLPAGFTGDCQFDAADTDSEIDCYVVDPIVPIGTLPDGLIATFRLETLNAPNGTIVPVDFSTDPFVTFGDPNGQYTSGAGIDGSVLIGQVSSVYKVFLPNLVAPIHAGGNSISGRVTDPYNYAIQNATVCAVGTCATTQVFGDYLISNLANNSYPMTANSPGLTCQAAFANPVTVPPSQTGINFICTPTTPGHWISGIIKDNNGYPQNSVIVADTGKGISTQTDARGIYYLLNLAAGAYNLTAQKAGYTCTASFNNPVSLPPSQNFANFFCTTSIN